MSDFMSRFREVQSAFLKGREPAPAGKEKSKGTGKRPVEGWDYLGGGLWYAMLGDGTAMLSPDGGHTVGTLDDLRKADVGKALFAERRLSELRAMSQPQQETGTPQAQAPAAPAARQPAQYGDMAAERAATDRLVGAAPGQPRSYYVPRALLQTMRQEPDGTVTVTDPSGVRRRIRRRKGSTDWEFADEPNPLLE